MAGRKITAEHDEVPEKAPSDSTLLDGKDIPLCEGLYVITNKMSRTTANLPDSGGGTRCSGYSQYLTGDFGNQLWIVQRSGSSSDTFTLQSFQHLVFLEVSDGNVNNGANVVGRARTEVADSRSNQEWSIVEQETHFQTALGLEHFLRSLMGKFNLSSSHRICIETFDENDLSNSGDGAAITCSAKAAKGDYQLWDLNRVSRSGEEIKAIIELWKPDLLGRLLELHESAEYFILPSQLRKEIWDGTRLLRQPVRPHLFDYDDFVIKSRDAVKTWARDRFSVDREGYCVLFGLIFGKAERGPNAYNWYLAPDMRSLVFFDAQTGKEYSTAALDEFEFKPTFATF